MSGRCFSVYKKDSALVDDNVRIIVSQWPPDGRDSLVFMSAASDMLNAAPSGYVCIALPLFPQSFVMIVKVIPLLLVAF